MNSETRLLVAFVVVLAAVIGVASAALRAPPSVAPTVAIEDLPIDRYQATYGPDPEACAAAGGEVHWELTHECFSDASVTDVCAFGVPCFGPQGDNTYCRDARAAYCACDHDDDRCPAGYECAFGDRCVQSPEEAAPIL